MPMATCPFCTSGEAWNVCGCRWALVAQRSNLIDARKGFAAAGSRPVVSARDFAPTTVLIVPAELPGTIAPPGKCRYCDRRRAINAASATKRRAKQKEQA